MSAATSTTIRATTATSTRTTTRRRARSARLVWALVVLAAWILFAFAGAFVWTVVPLTAGTLLLTLLVRPAIVQSPQRTLDLALLACLAVIAFQLVPLPAALRLALSPRVGVVYQALWVGAPLDPRTAAPAPLSIDVAATRLALTLAVTFVLLFWTARSALARGGVRTLMRGLAGTGLVLAILALAQHATAPTLLYWRFPTIFGAPFGPYRNRNDFATWLIMAIPMTAGYIAARIQTRQQGWGRELDLGRMLDVTAVWLGGAICLMSAALFASLSRSGLVSAAASLAAFLWLSRHRMSRKGRLAVLAFGAIVFVIALTYVQVGALKGRVDETLAAGIGGRGTIWRESLGMGRDFRVTGVGAGAYERGMLVYQVTRNGFQFNHAHNEYLQLLVEGGWLLAVPAAIAIAAGLVQIWRRLGRDRSPIFWIRVGAASGVIAIAVQSIWDTGLRMPANAVLFALLAAVALHAGEATTKSTIRRSTAENAELAEEETEDPRRSRRPPR